MHLWIYQLQSNQRLRLSRRWQCRSGHQQGLFGQSQERMPQQELVQWLLLFLIFSRSIGHAKNIQKTKKNGNTKTRCHHETRKGDNMIYPTNETYKWFSISSWLSCVIQTGWEPSSPWQLLSFLSISGCRHWFYVTVHEASLKTNDSQGQKQHIYIIYVQNHHIALGNSSNTQSFKIMFCQRFGGVPEIITSSSSVYVLNY